MASMASQINASSFRAGITNERRLSVIALQHPPRHHESAAGQHWPLQPRPDPQPGRSDFPSKRRIGEEAARLHAELRASGNVTHDLRNVERHDRPEEFT